MLRKFLLFIIVSVLFASCGNSEFPGFKEKSSGLLYKIHKDAGGIKAVPGDYMTLEMTYYTNEDSLLFDSQGQTFPLQLEKPVFKGDINEALALLGVNDSATFVIRADSFLINNAKVVQLPAFVDDHSKIIFHVKVHKIQTLEELKAEEDQARTDAIIHEKQLIEDYISDNQITVEPTETGLYVIFETLGKGKKAKVGDKVKVHYKGMFLDGFVFDSSYERNQPIEFVLGEGNVIDGWDEAIAMMREGDQATLLIPSSLGYVNGRGQIKSYTPLLFEVKLINVK